MDRLVIRTFGQCPVGRADKQHINLDMDRPHRPLTLKMPGPVLKHSLLICTLFPKYFTFLVEMCLDFYTDEGVRRRPVILTAIKKINFL